MTTESFQSIIEDLQYISNYIKAHGGTISDRYEEGAKPSLTQHDTCADYEYYTVTCGACGEDTAEIYHDDSKGKWGNMDVYTFDPVNIGHKYCSYCGRKIDWSEILEVDS